MVLQTMEIHQFQFDKVIDVPVVKVLRVGRVLCTGTGDAGSLDSQVFCHPI